mmetsp:Transcript_14695/g.25015  ORF Transcript_14695/g.25015 Transcript_14695/m.25015 type:complete len:110 (-) Transcript_14695:43-372(-)
MSQLKQVKKQAKREGDEDGLAKVREMIGQEKQISMRLKQKKEEEGVLDEMKQQNRERASKGFEPVFHKKRDMKTIKLKKQFDELDKKGKLDKFLDEKTQEVDKKRQRRT